MTATLETPSLIIKRELYDAVIFDLDGVVTRTADVHAKAWKQMFDLYREERQQRELPDFEPFDMETDYPEHLDGKPRYDGVQSFLRSRGVELPYGEPDDAPEFETVCGLGNYKQNLFLRLLKESGVEVYESTVDLIRQLKQRGFKVAIISASKNCKAALEAAGIEDLFDARVDGVEAAKLKLKGKPAPDVFIEAAKRLDVDPYRAIVVEDALAGVKAGRAGGFATVIGVDRRNQSEKLKEHGANWVIEDLSELHLNEPSEGRQSTISQLPSALEKTDEILKQAEGPLAVFLDYDGTLTPIVAHAKDAELSDEMRKTVHELAQHTTVGIISGRDLKDVRKRVGLKEIFYAGSHGYEIVGPEDFHHTNQEAQNSLLAIHQAESCLRKEFLSVPGAEVERKEFAIAVHYRNVPEEHVSNVERIVKQITSQHNDIRMSGGKKIFELQPDIDWNKGRALEWLLETLELDASRVLPFYLGDDLTDEDVFKALAERGVGVVVRDKEEEDRPTAAQYALADTDEVRAVLERLVEHAKTS